MSGAHIAGRVLISFAGNGSRTQETVCSLHDELPFGNLKKRVSRFFFCAAEENGDIVV